jgi:uncharacterized protein (DUF3820 family)
MDLFKEGSESKRLVVGIPERDLNWFTRRSIDDVLSGECFDLALSIAVMLTTLKKLV